MGTLYVKNMVCDRCRMSIEQVLDKMKIPYRRIDLGEIELTNEPDEKFLEEFRQNITPLGFELIEDKNSRTISKIKSTVIDLVRGNSPAHAKKIKLSTYLSETIGKDYHTLSSLFSGVEGVTIEQFHILQKIEYVKELLAYDELSLSEIAHKLQYSSVQHLSNQFKKVTGLTPSHFKSIRHGRRTSIDKV
ncbi:MAG TPA: AraC family transcriptional regulator [Cyclobacteriaceae bacterium]|nr:AraC family transcriptional regulator [Cyclobacteriaceae bacterium]